MKCPKCNTENPDTLKFCGECGTQLAASYRFLGKESILMLTCSAVYVDLSILFAVEFVVLRVRPSFDDVSR